ncbi:unnamed protein product [Prorocentrum cordatum]|uniref:Protein kinase domain-containing protein n=1 Tax=Prorocentrum cordatum TaxID=2364126 RepID=A0ABN9UTZ0_9DINO|nr:unnamed protein product [Polarella glacialis]
MKDLDHPSICKLFETYAKGRHMFFVMEHLEGGDVGNRLVEQGPLPEPMAAAIARQVSGALLYAHSKGIAHRDMKPENICFCSTSPDEFRVKVIDWGLGKHFIEGRLCSSVGTISYTAPEVLMAVNQDQAAGYTSSCDLWSLGVTAYTMLSCKAPFWGQLEKQLRKMQDERYPLSGSIWDGISDEGKSFVSQLLKFAPEERISAAELLGHPWTVGHAMPRDTSCLAEVLRNVERFSHASDILFFCTASLARQLDHRSLTKIYRAFSWLDADGDGRLALPEFANGFREVFGADSGEFRDVENVFDRLDFERTGSLSYTTFCAAGISEDYHTDDDMLLAAFKTFDVLDNGRISPEDMQEVSSAPVWKDLANHVMEKMGRQEGGVSFEEWAMLVRESARAGSLSEDLAMLARSHPGAEALIGLLKGQLDRCGPEHLHGQPAVVASCPPLCLVGPMGGLPTKLLGHLLRVDMERFGRNEKKLHEEGHLLAAEVRREEGLADEEAGLPALPAPPVDAPAAKALADRAGAGDAARAGYRLGDELLAGTVPSRIANDRGIVELADGTMLAVAKAGTLDGAATPRDGDKAGERDLRTLPVRLLSEAVDIMSTSAKGDWPVLGPRTTLWLLQQFKRLGQTPLQRHVWWRQIQNLTAADAGVDERQFLSELLEMGATKDQLNEGELGIFEAVSRRYQLWEEVCVNRLREQEAGALRIPGGSAWLDEREIFLGQERGGRSALVSPELQTWVAGRLQSEAAVLKQRRKGREEKIIARGGVADDAPAAKTKANAKGKAGAEGAT